MELPAHITPPFDVFVNGIPQLEGRDYEVVGTVLVLERTLKEEGKLGFWRMLSMFLGIAGTYRQNDLVDVAYTLDGRQLVWTVRPTAYDPASS